MSALLAALWKPKIVTSYYKTELLRQPVFWLATILTILTAARVRFAGGRLVFFLVMAVWLHLILQHSRIRRALPIAAEDELLMLMSWSTMALWVLFFLAVNILLPRP
jgi:hypothetical protein